MKFVSEFVSQPGVVGAVAPSSRGLARRMVEWIDWANVDTVVEYGAGTGIFTEFVLARMRPDARLLVIEINPNLAEILAKRFPAVRVHQDCVKNVESICRREGIDRVDAVVSGLPWAAFSAQDQNGFLEALLKVLGPGGQFATFAYLQGLLLPAGRRFRDLLGRHFTRIDRSGIAWMNLPPAFVYRCSR